MERKIDINREREKIYIDDEEIHIGPRGKTHNMNIRWVEEFSAGGGARFCPTDKCNVDISKTPFF